MSIVPKSLRDGLLSEVLMNGNSNETSGNSYTVTGDADLDEDSLNRANRSYNFDGTEHLLIVDGTASGPTNTDWTIHIRFKFQTPTGSESIYGYYDGTDTKSTFIYFPSSNAPSFYIRSGFSGYRIRACSQSLTADTWYDMTITWDVSTNTPNIYINNVLKNGGLTSDSTVGDCTSVYCDTAIGGRNRETGSTDTFSKITVESCRTWNRILTSEEINQLLIRGIGTGI